MTDDPIFRYLTGPTWDIHPGFSLQEADAWRLAFGPISPQSAAAPTPAPCPHHLANDTEIVEAMIASRSESIQVFLERLRKKGFDLIRRKSE